MLTFNEALKLVGEIVASKPEDYKYTEDEKTKETRASKSSSATAGNGCYYAHFDGTPGCIVGQVIHKLNPEFDLSSVETFSVHNALYAAGILADFKAESFLNQCQAEQDRGRTWKEAQNWAEYHA